MQIESIQYFIDAEEKLLNDLTQKGPQEVQNTTQKGLYALKKDFENKNALIWRSQIN
jgi:hypothetical protein